MRESAGTATHTLTHTHVFAGGSTGRSASASPSYAPSLCRIIVGEGAFVLGCGSITGALDIFWLSLASRVAWHDTRACIASHLVILILI